MTALSKLAKKNETIEVSVENQAIILGLSIKMSKDGEPFFTLDKVDEIEAAMVEDGALSKEIYDDFFDNYEVETAMFTAKYPERDNSYWIPKGDWLNLEESKPSKTKRRRLA